MVRYAIGLLTVFICLSVYGCNEPRSEIPLPAGDYLLISPASKTVSKFTVNNNGESIDKGLYPAQLCSAIINAVEGCDLPYVIVPVACHCNNPFSDYGFSDDAYGTTLILCSVCGMVVASYTTCGVGTVIAYTVCAMCAGKGFDYLHDSRWQPGRSHQK